MSATLSRFFAAILLALALLAALLPTPASAQFDTLPDNIAPSTNRCLAKYTSGTNYVLGWAFVSNMYAVGSPKEATPNTYEFIAGAGACSLEHAAGEALKLTKALDADGVKYGVVVGGSADIKDYAGDSDEGNTKLAARRISLIEEAAKKVGLNVGWRDMPRIKQKEYLRISYIWVIPEKDLTDSLRASFSLADTNEIMRLGRLPDVSDWPFDDMLSMADWPCGGTLRIPLNGMPQPERYNCSCAEDEVDDLNSAVLKQFITQYGSGRVIINPTGQSGDEYTVSVGGAVTPRKASAYGVCGDTDVAAGRTIFDPSLNKGVGGCRVPATAKEAIIGLRHAKLPDLNREAFRALRDGLQRFGVSFSGDLFEDGFTVLKFPDHCGQIEAKKAEVELVSARKRMIARHVGFGPEFGGFFRPLALLAGSGPNRTVLPGATGLITGRLQAGFRLGDLNGAVHLGAVLDFAGHVQLQHEASWGLGVRLAGSFGRRDRDISGYVAGSFVWQLGLGSLPDAVVDENGQRPAGFWPLFHRFGVEGGLVIHPRGSLVSGWFGPVLEVNTLQIDPDGDGMGTHVLQPSFGGSVGVTVHIPTRRAENVEKDEVERWYPN